MTGVPGTARYQAISPGTYESTVAIGDDGNRRFTVLRRTRNALVVVLPSGDTRKFSLESGLAKQFHQERRSKNVANVLREAGELLEGAERTELATFLVGYTEPQRK